MVEAVPALEAQLGQPIAGICSIEIGGINAAAVLDASARLGIAVSTLTTRVAPSPSCTPRPRTSSASKSCRGRQSTSSATVVDPDAPSNALAERIGKHLALASLGLIGCALVALPAREVKRIYVANTIAECLGVGRAIRDRASGTRTLSPLQLRPSAAGSCSAAVVQRTWENTGYHRGLPPRPRHGRFGRPRTEDLVQEREPPLVARRRRRTSPALTSWRSATRRRASRW